MAIERTDNGEQNTGLRAPIGWWGRATDFVSEVRSEMKRVTWPSRREVYATTLVVIITSAFFGVYLFGVDLALNRIVRYIFDRFGAA